MSLDMEQKIAGVTQYWNVDAVPAEFLDWLGSWLAVFSDDNWPEEKKRSLLKEAFQLYKARGTLNGLRRVIEIFADGEVGIIEHFRLRPPMVLGQASHIGMTSFVGPKPSTRLILEESSRIGDFVLVEDEDPPEKPFEHDAYDITILVDTSALKDPALESALRRLIEAEKPAHTRYTLRTIHGAAAQLGSRSLLGVDTLLTGGKPMRLGENSTVGTTTLLRTKQPLKGAIGVRSRIAVDAILY
jgi:phage tail-like protein